MAGEYTNKVEDYVNIIKSNDIITEDGEVVELHDSVMNDLAMDFITMEEQKRAKKNESALVRKEISEDHKELISMYGCFYFNFYKRYKTTEKQYIFRFLYICTYMNYDNYIANNRRRFNEKDLKTILKLSNTEYFRTITYLVDNNFIKIDDNDNVFVNDKLCKKGKINKTKSIEVIRMFDDAIKELYENSTPREHKKIAMLVELIPYIHYKYNILCKNPHCENREEVETYSIKELCDILGYDKSNSSRLKRDLLKIKVSGEPIIGIFEKYNGKTIYVNPRIFYKGKVKYIKEVDEKDGLSLATMFAIK